MADLNVSIGNLELENPVMVASGTFGYAGEFRDFMELKSLGAIVTKTITLESRQGNLPPRTCETPSGMLNSIGLENPGIEGFIRDKLPELIRIGPPVIVSISSENDPKEFVELARKLEKIKGVAALELNISCPNIKSARRNARLISQDPAAAFAVVKSVRKATRKTIITKLSPNVTDIAEIAKACEDAGTDAVSLVNTFYGMSINIRSGRPRLGSVSGGLSGPAIRPIAVRMVWEAYQKIKIPIIGMGGIMNSADAIEFFLAGASAISVGTANFINPAASIEVLEGIKKYLNRNKVKGIKDLTGSIKI
ncbi:MAG: dihydroorotate dehydrogenase [Candidatus Omnitrophota bacterium]|jgi:dihydroorotate dehydrogenase (NAD+) catalytic subunit